MISRLPLIAAAASVGIALNACSRQHPPAAMAYAPGLGEIMAQTASRHAKLWFAGQARNWRLADYELDELKEGFEDAAKFHPTHKTVSAPLPQLIAQTMGTPAQELELAIKKQNLDEFTKAYDRLTASCNACHQISDFGFNVVTRPAGNPFVNQAFDRPE